MHTLVVGDFGEAARDEIQRGAARASTTVVFCPQVPKALQRLRTGNERPQCVLIAGDAGVKTIVDGMREEAALFAVPVLVLLPRPTSDGYRGAYMAGADDVMLTSDSGGLTRRLANMNLFPVGSRPAATHGEAVIVALREGSRRRLGRTLRQVGFEVTFAASVDEIAELARRGNKPKFAVVVGHPPPQQEGARRSGMRNVASVADIPALFLSAAEAELEESLEADGQIADVTGKLLFFADEQAKAGFKDRRSSPRMLYSAICSFREAGALQSTFGVTHNLSREGMYVRTLDPPRASSTIWVELETPVTRVPIHVRAKAVWQHLPGSGKGLLPPGFGLRIEAEQCPPADLRALVEGYEVLGA